MSPAMAQPGFVVGQNWLILGRQDTTWRYWRPPGSHVWRGLPCFHKKKRRALDLRDPLILLYEANRTQVLFEIERLAF